MNIKDKVWVVTGAGSGMGREVTLRLIEKGAHVAMVDLNEDSLSETADLAHARARAHAPSISSHVLNISDREGVFQLPEAVIREHGHVDGLINNAGIIQPFVKVQDLAFDSIERVMQVNFYGTLYMTKAFLPHLRARPEAHLVNVSSMGGFLPVPGQAIYGASKAAVKLMTEALFAEMQGTGVQVSTVFPGAVETNITENSKVDAPNVDGDESSFQVLKADEAARIIVDGIQKNRYHIFVGKDARMMDKLTRLMPRRAALIIANKMKSLLN